LTHHLWRAQSKAVTTHDLPGGLICDAVGLTGDSDNRQILRMFLNTPIWGAAGVVTILLLSF
jgi:hypothetical protein